MLTCFPEEIRNEVMVVPCFSIFAGKTVGEDEQDGAPAAGKEKGVRECMVAMIIRLEP